MPVENPPFESAAKKKGQKSSVLITSVFHSSVLQLGRDRAARNSWNVHCMRSTYKCALHARFSSRVADINVEDAEKFLTFKVQAQKLRVHSTR